MLQEAGEGPAAAARLLAAEGTAFEALGAELRHHPPQSVLTVARGSSDHAAQYMAYLVMARLGRLVTSLPMSLVTLYQSRLPCDGLLALACAPRGPAFDGLLLTAQMRARGACVLLAAPPDTPGAELPLSPTGHVDLDPITAVQAFYRMVETLARARGLDPDRPRHLNKVTRTS
jgi:glucosamine--fructose-6-phosphate aminotransferase (isomerizing)